MDGLIVDKQDELVMKLLHYFITEEGYNPIVLHGAKNEIWLENLDNPYKIIRIVTNYIHNDEQLNFDVLRANQIAKKIKKKTFCFKIKTLSIFINLGDNVHILDNEEYKFNNIDCINLKDMEDISKYRFVIDEFPDITRNTKFPEDGFELFAKLSREISEKSGEDAKKAEDIFQKRKPIMTYILIGINTILFVLMYILGNGSDDALTLLKFGASYPDFIRAGEYYRLLTSAFLHIGFLHFLFNNYALYVIGSQLESFFGKTKYLIIYLGSAIFGNLMSLLFTNSISAGASGAIFGLLGALLYFGYHYRVYLGNMMTSQIIPVLILNFLLGFMIKGIDLASHIGGFIGGLLLLWALGVTYKSKKNDKIQGWILFMMFFLFLFFLVLR